MSGCVTISTSGVPPRLKSISDRSAPTLRPVPPPTWTVFAASSSRCARTNPISNAFGARHCQGAADAERLVVLGDLVALRVVRIEVVLPREHRLLGDLRAERKAELDRPIDGGAVRDRQRARVRQADRAGVRVLRRPEARLAPAEHLRARLQMDMDLEADDCLPAAHVPFSSLSLTRWAASAIASQSGMPSSLRLASSWDAFGSPG